MRFHVCNIKKTGNYTCPNSFIQFWCAFKIVCLCGVRAFPILEVLDICLGPAIYQLNDTGINMNQTEVAGGNSCNMRQCSFLIYVTPVFLNKYFILYKLDITSPNSIITSFFHLLYQIFSF